jgi:hypothetical protein
MLDFFSSLFFLLPYRNWTVKQAAPLRIAAHNAFREFKVHSEDPYFHFDGSTARIVHEVEDLIGMTSNTASYSLTIYAHNEVGEYFMYIANQNGSPFFKHLSHTNAKVVLGNVYVDPAEIKANKIA